MEYEGMSGCEQCAEVSPRYSTLNCGLQNGIVPVKDGGELVCEQSCVQVVMLSMR
jgi:hypothetical protein